MKNIRFKDIERIESFVKQNNDSPLQIWYDNVREKRLSDFSIEDICKAVRQNLFIKYVMPKVITLLEENMLAGELYEGELIAAVTNMPVKEWANIPTEMATKTKEILMDARNKVDSKLKGEIDFLLQRISSIKNGEQ